MVKKATVSEKKGSLSAQEKVIVSQFNDTLAGDLKDFYKNMSDKQKVAYASMSNDQRVLQEVILREFGAKRDPINPKKWIGAIKEEGVAPEKAIKTIQFTPTTLQFNNIPINAEVLLPKYIAGYKPFQYQPGFTKSQNEWLLEDHNSDHYKKMESLMSQPAVQLIQSKEDKPRLFTKEDKATCVQPVQIRIFGSMNEVTSLTKSLTNWLNSKEVKDILWADEQFKAKQEGKHFEPSPPNVGFMKLECDKKDRTCNYCSDTMRSYISPKFGMDLRQSDKKVKYPTKPLCIPLEGFPKIKEINQADLFGILRKQKAIKEEEFEIMED